MAQVEPSAAFGNLLATGVLSAGLLAIAVTDWRQFRIPDLLSLPLMGLGLMLSLASGDWQMRLAGAVVGYLAFWLVETVYRRLRGEDGLGRGDAKLLAVGGAWCGLTGLPMIVLIAAGSALIFALATGRGRRDALPFGPFLSLAIAMVYILN